jgi:hypothetical protein
MADDLKKKLVQYGDKVLFGLFVVVLVATAAFTLIGNTKSGSDADTRLSARYKPSKETLDEQIGKLSQQIDSGGIPDGYITGGFATDPDEINAGPGEVACENCGWIMPENVLRCPRCGHWRKNDDDKDGMPNDWEDKYQLVDRYTPDADKDPDGDGFSNLKEYLGGSSPDDPKSIPSPFRMTSQYRRRVDIRFKGFTIKEGGSLDVIDPAFWVVQINYGRGSDTALVSLGSHFHGYKLFPLERTKVLRKGEHGIPDWYENVYVLSIQRRGQEPIKLEKDKWGTTNETYVDLLVTRGPDSGKAFKGSTVGDVIVANGQRFEIIEMRDNKVIMQGSEGEIYTLY